MGKIESRLAELGITLPTPAAPMANYVPYMHHREAGGHFRPDPAAGRQGRLRRQARRGRCRWRTAWRRRGSASSTCVAQLRAACGGDLDRVARVVRLGGFIAAPAGFTQHAAVMNGASDLAVEVFGEIGRHARSTIGVPSLPGDAAVEVEGMFESPDPGSKP